MLFSSLVFLYVFLPITLLLYWVFPKKFKNPILFLASMLFFAWGGVSYSLLLVFSLIFNFFIGIIINKQLNKKLMLSIGIGINLLFLIIFKYANFIIDNLNQVFSWFNIPVINNPTILLPVGISFYTFQAISYLIDIYRKTCEVQRNFISLGLYISFFPQLIAGPIVRYYDIQKQLSNRKIDIEKLSSGIKRFVLGFGKKVLIANNMAYIADEIFARQPETLNSGMAWIGIIAYSLQIYYDFSGYSDMAIGLARMFGFELLENFNFPYISKSIKEFWRRWHISLSNWFRDYLYIPLGGNRKGNNRTVLNLFIVFFVTGFWHGASWNFLIWGLLHGFFLFLERTKFQDLLNKLPKFLQSSYTLFIALMAWVLFRAETLAYAIQFYKSLLGTYEVRIDKFLLSKLINQESILVFIIAILGAFGFFPWLNTRINDLMNTVNFDKKTYGIVKKTTLVLGIVIVLLYGTGNLVLGAYNPFIYFRF